MSQSKIASSLRRRISLRVASQFEKEAKKPFKMKKKGPKKKKKKISPAKAEKIYAEYLRNFKKTKKDTGAKKPMQKNLYLGMRGFKEDSEGSDFKKKLKFFGEKAAKKIMNSPKKMQEFVLNKDKRNASLKKAGGLLKKNVKSISKSLVSNMKNELKGYGKMAGILKSLAKEKRKPTWDETKQMLGTSAYIIGGALTAMSTAGALPAATAAGAAIAKSTFLHAAFATISEKLDFWGFLGAEYAESVGAVQDLASQGNFFTNLTGGAGTTWPLDKIIEGLGAVTKLASDKKPSKKVPETMEEFTEGILLGLADYLSKGISDEEMKKIVNFDVDS